MFLYFKTTITKTPQSLSSMMLFQVIILIYSILPLVTSKCYFSAFYISESPAFFVDCNFAKGNFCYAKASFENRTQFRYGCDTTKRITEELCDYRENCTHFNSNLCCCKSDGCNHISDIHSINEEYENVTFVSKLSTPLRPPDRRHLNFVTVGVLIVSSIACIITYIPVFQTARAAIESLKKLEEFYIENVRSGTAALIIAKKVNKTLRETLFLEELLFRLNTLRRFEELSSPTYVKSPRQKNTKVLKKLETDSQFLHLIENYTISRKEMLERREMIKRRQRKQRYSE